MAVTTSPGLTALPEGMFLQRGTSPMTLTGHSSWAMAVTVATTQAAPPMSPFIAPIPAEGLMDIPPVSKVTPRKLIHIHVHVHANKMRLCVYHS